MKKQYLTRKDVSDLLGVSIKTIYAWTRQGKIKFNFAGTIAKSELFKLLSIENTTSKSSQ